MKKLIYLLIVAVGFVACGKSSHEPDQEPEKELHEITFNLNDFNVDMVPFGTKSTNTEQYNYDYVIYDASDNSFVKHKQFTPGETITDALEAGTYNIFMLATSEEDITDWPSTFSPVNTQSYQYSYILYANENRSAYAVNKEIIISADATINLTLERVTSCFKVEVLDFPADDDTNTYTLKVIVKNAPHYINISSLLSYQNNLDASFSPDATFDTGKTIEGHMPTESADTEHLYEFEIKVLRDGVDWKTTTLTDVPLKRNRITEISGKMFEINNTFTVTVDDTWDTTVQYNF